MPWSLQDPEAAEPVESSTPAAASKPAPPAKPAAPAKPAQAEPETEEQRESKAKAQRKQEALQAKEQGNAAYKAKKFDEAISHYDKAFELYDEDISFLTNRWVWHLTHVPAASHSFDLCCAHTAGPVHSEPKHSCVLW